MFGAKIKNEVGGAIKKQLVSLLKSHASGLARFCMGDDQLCTGDVGVTNFVGALWSLGGCSWLLKQPCTWPAQMHET